MLLRPSAQAALRTRLATLHVPMHARSIASMPVFFADCYHVDLPPGHRFPMERYRAVHAMLRETMASAPTLPLRIERALPASREDILRAHDAAYIDGYNAGTLPAAAYREIGFPWSSAFVERTATITGGTLQATHFALSQLRARARDGLHWLGPGGMAANQAGGTHHAFSAKGEGFCIQNDLSIAAWWAQAQPQRALWDCVAAAPSFTPRVLVIDLDVHQGNGTADIHRGDDSVFTFSAHGAKNWPWKTRQPSDFDVDVPDQAGDDVYLPLLHQSMVELEHRLKASAAPQFVAPSAPAHSIDGVRVSGPDPSLGVSLVLYQAGVDPLMHDRLGRLKLTRIGLQERNDAVLRWCEARGLPVAVTMGGGYSRPIEHSARCHVDVFVQAAQSWARRLRAWEDFTAANAAGAVH